MAAGDDLQMVNHALRELARLQLSGELSADVAWRERRQMLEAVEAAWGELPEAADTGETTLPVVDAVVAEAPVAVPVLPPTASRRALNQLWRLPLWALLLTLAVLTFLYVSSL